MKRIVLLTVSIILIMCCLSSCIIIPRYHHFEIDTSTVSSIQIYDLCENEDYSSRFLETETPVYEIPKEQTASFVAELNSIEFSDYIIIVLAAIDPSFNYGEWTVRINYSDGTYELISNGGYGETYDSNNERVSGHHWSCDDAEWEAFIGKYIPAEIYNHHIEIE